MSLQAWTTATPSTRWATRASDFHSLVHGGPAAYNPTRTRRNFTLGELAAFFNSRAGANVTVGEKSLVQQAKLASGTTIPPCTVRVGAATSSVEWCDVPFPLCLRKVTTVKILFSSAG